MAQLMYTMITSLDGYVSDKNGNFDWGVPDDEVHQFINDLERPIGTHLYGRRMYEVMMGWETNASLAEQSGYLQDFAQIWQAADKVVFSRSLQTVSTAKTRIVREFDPRAIEQMKKSAESDLSIGGPGLAGEAFEAGLVDECHLILAPIAVGNGTKALPTTIRLDLKLLAERRFDGGMVYLHYRINR